MGPNFNNVADFYENRCAGHFLAVRLPHGDEMVREIFLEANTLWLAQSLHHLPNVTVLESFEGPRFISSQDTQDHPAQGVVDPEHLTRKVA